MRINSMGTECDGNVLDLDDRRTNVDVGPKARGTMATLLLAALSINVVETPVLPPREESPAIHITAVLADENNTGTGIQAAVARFRRSCELDSARRLYGDY